MTRTNQTIVGMLAAALVTALAIPAFAFGSSPSSESTAQSLSQRASAQTVEPTSARAQANARRAAEKAAREKAAQKRAKAKKTRDQILARRVENQLRARRARFDAASANITRRIARVAALAVRVKAAGGDVTAVRSKLDEARTRLAEALAAEAKTAELFRAVPGASNRRVAFASARVAGRKSAVGLAKARIALKDATRLLRVEVTKLRESGV